MELRASEQWTRDEETKIAEEIKILNKKGV